MPKKILPEEKERIVKEWEIINSKIDDFLKSQAPKDASDDEHTMNDEVPARKIDVESKESFAVALKSYITYKWKKKKNHGCDSEEYEKSETSRIRKYRQKKRVSEIAVYELTEFYNFLCSRDGAEVPGQYLVPANENPLGINGNLIKFLRRKGDEFSKNLEKTVRK